MVGRQRLIHRSERERLGGVEPVGCAVRGEADAVDDRAVDEEGGPAAKIRAELVGFTSVCV